ncbi:CPBP family intramembrane glutamic endopeptidase [Solilutibacter silvestris]|uniref:CPBP family intramembrane glutamic endopeptidase n=1 Tax=Solilutibacter silvestris TaxID=1645665 RepID=UPI003D333275
MLDARLFASTWRGVPAALLGTLVYALLVIGGVLLTSFILHALQISLHGHGDVEGPSSIASTAITLAIVLAATAVVAKIQHRGVADFGLRDGSWTRKALRGAMVGFALCAALIGVLALLGAIRIEPSGQTLAGGLLYAVVWAVGYLAVGLMEETLFRGYPLFRLTKGMGFFPAALITSSVFGVLHLGNDKETAIAGVNAVLFALVLCWSVRATGSLWWAIGFHSAWDWAESFLFGCPDSGIKAQGRLFDTVSSASDWLSGGTAGPEGSVLTIAVIVLAGLWLYREQRSRLAD